MIYVFRSGAISVPYWSARIPGLLIFSSSSNHVWKQGRTSCAHHDWEKKTMKEKNPGFLLALPTMIVLFLFFIVPLCLVVLYSFQQPYSFNISSNFSLLNFKDFFGEGYYSSLGWSVLLAFLTTVILFLVCYPCAYAMAKVFPRASIWITLCLLCRFLSPVTSGCLAGP